MILPLFVSIKTPRLALVVVVRLAIAAIVAIVATTIKHSSSCNNRHTRTDTDQDNTNTVPILIVVRIRVIRRRIVPALANKPSQTLKPKESREQPASARSSAVSVRSGGMVWSRLSLAISSL